MPGSMMVAWPRMRTAEAPTSQKKVLKGDAKKEKDEKEKETKDGKEAKGGKTS